MSLRLATLKCGSKFSPLIWICLLVIVARVLPRSPEQVAFVSSLPGELSVAPPQKLRVLGQGEIHRYSTSCIYSSLVLAEKGAASSQGARNKSIEPKSASYTGGDFLKERLVAETQAAVGLCSVFLRLQSEAEGVNDFGVEELKAHLDDLQTLSKKGVIANSLDTRSVNNQASAAELMRLLKQAAMTSLQNFLDDYPEHTEDLSEQLIVSYLGAATLLRKPGLVSKISSEISKRSPVGQSFHQRLVEYRATSNSSTNELRRAARIRFLSSIIDVLTKGEYSNRRSSKFAGAK